MFIGTVNYELGLKLGKTLNKLNLNGRYYGVITEMSPNLIAREDGIRHRLEEDYQYPSKWREISYSLLNCRGNISLAIKQMYLCTLDPHIQAVISVAG